MSRNTRHTSGLRHIDGEVLDRALSTGEIEAAKERELQSRYHRNWAIMYSVLGLIILLAVAGILLLN